MSRRAIAFVVAALVLAGSIGGFVWHAHRSFPPDGTPEGAYARIVVAITSGRPRDAFAYLETRAQWAAYSIRDYRSRARARVEQGYPEPERTRLLEEFRAEAEAPDGPDEFALLAERRGFVARLRKDLSGIRAVEVAGDRATIETARGTRYAFRRRDNGIWGLTTFTGELVAEAEKAARDFEVVSRAADDYARGAAH